MEKKISIIETKEIAKKDGSGNYYVAKILLDGVDVEALCFDAKIKTMTGEQTLDVTEKNGKHFINFPREGKSGGGKPWGKSPAELHLQANSFAMAYSKDILVALIGKMATIDETKLKLALFDFYHAIRKELGNDPAQGGKVQPAPPSQATGDVMNDTPPVKTETTKKTGLAIKCPDTGKWRPREDCDNCEKRDGCLAIN